MRTLRLGVYDEEREYVEKLTAYLNKNGNGRWAVYGYTDSDLLEHEVMSSSLDLVFGTSRNVLRRVKKLSENMPVMYLCEEGVSHGGGFAEMPSVYRYQNAAAISGALEKMVSAILLEERDKIPVIAVYSPVGRCGKTGFALRLVNQGSYGRWLYIGMEEYSCLESDMGTDSIYADGDSFLYFVKERNEERVAQVLRECGDIIPSAFSPFDIKCLDYADMEWLMKQLNDMERVSGIVFDVGTGVLSDINMLNLFDRVVVPFLNQEKSMKKRQRFEELISANGLDRLFGKILFVNMENENEIVKALERISDFV